MELITQFITPIFAGTFLYVLYKVVKKSLIVTFVQIQG